MQWLVQSDHCRFDRFLKQRLRMRAIGIASELLSIRLETCIAAVSKISGDCRLCVVVLTSISVHKCELHDGRQADSHLIDHQLPFL